MLTAEQVNEVDKGGNLSDKLLLQLLQMSKQDVEARFRLTKRIVVLTVQGIKRLDGRSKLQRLPIGHQKPKLTLYCRHIWHLLCWVELDESELEHAWAESEQMALIFNTATKKGRRVFYNEIYQPGSDNTNKSDQFELSMKDFYNSVSRDWCEDGTNPWSHLELSKSWDVLDNAPRTRCSGCGKSVKVFCSICVEPRGIPNDSLPTVRSDVKIHILLHPAEPRQGSSGIQAAVLSPDIIITELEPKAPSPLPSISSLSLKSSNSNPTSNGARKCGKIATPTIFYNIPAFDPETTALLYPSEVLVDFVSF